MVRSIEVQVLSPEDWQLWRRLRLEALTESEAAFGATLAQWTGPGDTEERWRARLSTVPMNVVLRWRGTPAGMVSASVRPDGAVELLSMWVAPSARGRGVGDTAVRTVVEWAGPREVVLSVKADNERAIGLYERHGFIDMGGVPGATTERLMRLQAGPTSP